MLTKKNLPIILQMLILSQIFYTSIQINLIPDSQNPITIYFPTSIDINNKLTLRFSFPSNSSGMSYGHYIGIIFPQKADDDFKFDNIDTFTCSLSNNETKFNVIATASQPSSVNPDKFPAEDSIAFCRLVDKINAIKVGVEFKYTLSITFNFKLASVVILKSIGLITATTNTPDRIIIDSIPVIGTAGIYPDHKKSIYKPMSIDNATIKITSGTLINQKTDYTINEGSVKVSDPLVYLFPYSTFDISLEIKIGTKSFLDPANCIIAFKYPTDTVEFPKSVSSESIFNEDKTFQGIKFENSLQISFLSKLEGIFAINNWTEILVPNRVFQLTLKEWKTKDTNLVQIKPLELYVFYKNSYNIMSYHSVNIFTVKPAILTMTVNHPEYWDIYRNGAWPFKFSIKSNTDYLKEGYILIQHVNAKNNLNKVNLMPSTCDFSEWDGISNAFGIRVNCFPLRTDYNYVSSTDNPYPGSAVFFKVPLIKQGTNYILYIWGFADNCGGTNKPLEYINSNINDRFTQFNFKIKIFKSITPTAINEMRFQNISETFGESVEVTMLNKCWNNLISFSSNIPLFFESRQLEKNITISPIGTGTDILLFKEITDWKIGSQLNSNTCNTGNSCYALDTSSTSFPEKFLYSTSPLPLNSYFLASFKIKSVKNDKLLNYLPLNGAFISTTTANMFVLTSGRLVIQFPSKFLVQGESYQGVNPKCYFSWANQIDSTPSSQISLLKSDVDLLTPPLKANAISSQGNNPSIDKVLTNFNPISSTQTTPNRIVSVPYFGSESQINQFEFMTDFFKPGQTYFNIGLFSNCVKWTLPPIKSLYTYIDIQIQWYYSKTSETQIGIPSKNIRMIKLFPEGGVFNDFTSTLNYDKMTTNPLITHLIYGTNYSDNGICLIELSGNLLSTSNSNDGKSNTLAIWIAFGTLLETDYSDASSNYPIAPLVNNISSFGLQSPPPLTKENLYASLDSINFNKILSDVNSLTMPDENRTSYFFMMGSLIILNGFNINNISPTTTLSNLLIPYYCPYNLKSSDVQIDLYASKYVPTVFAVWLDMTRYDDIKSTTRILSWGSSGKKVSILFPNSLKTKSFPLNVIQFTATIRFSPYTTSDDILYIYNQSRNPYNVNNIPLNCSGHVLLLNTSYISIDYSAIGLQGIGYTATIGVFPPQNIPPSKLNIFYAFGKVFNIAVLAGIGTSSVPQNNIGVSSLTDLTSTVYYSGIKRPSLDVLNNPPYSFQDLILYCCTSSGGSLNDLNFLSNNNRNSNFYNNFLLDYNSGEIPWPDPIFQLDKDEKIDPLVIDDPGSNMQMIINLPIEIPQIAELTFTSSNFYSNTICGIIDNIPKSDSTGIVDECNQQLIDSQYYFACPTITKSKSFKICCYNLNISDEISLTEIYVNIPNKMMSTFGLNTKLIIAPIDPLNNNYKLVTNMSENGIDIINTQGALITKIIYSHVEQDSGIGKISFIITLPRIPLRNMKITLEGDLTLMAIDSLKPRCEAFLSNSTEFTPRRFGEGGWDTGDTLIESCLTDLKNSITNPIVVLTKRNVYKCGLSFGKILTIEIWPVFMPNFNQKPYLTNTYRILMNLRDPPNKYLAYRLDYFNFYYPKQIKSKPIMQMNPNLCQMNTAVGITKPQPVPRIPGEFADYQFDFYYKANLKSLFSETGNANELTIFFPYEYYGAMLDDIVCYFGEKIIRCNFSDEGILNIILEESMITKNAEFFSVNITGVKNPSVDNDIIFACSINKTNFSSGERINLVVGFFNYVGGFPLKSNLTSSGNLVVINITSDPQKVSQNSPPLTTLTFRVTLDYSNDITKAPVTIISIPWILIYFPSSYRLFEQTATPITAVINEYSNDQNNIITRTNIYNPDSIIRTGNRILLELQLTLIQFAQNFRYWDIVLTNVPYPHDINNQTVNLSVIKKFHIILTHQHSSSIYRTLDNLDTQFTSKLLPIAIDEWIKYVRGSIFPKEEKKWFIDIVPYSKDKIDTTYNILIIPLGRYARFSFVIKKNTNNNITPAATNVTLTDKFIKLSEPNYILSTSIGEPIQFYLGVACECIPGKYLINFSFSNIENFVFTPPITILADNSTKGTIFYKTPQYVSIAGSTFIYIFLNEPNFDPLFINWKYGDLHVNDKSSVISRITIPSLTVTDNESQVSQIRSIYTSTYQGVLKSQKFQVENPNSCYVWINNLLSIEMMGNLTSIDKSINLAKSFDYKNTDKNSNLQMKNSIRFNFTPPYNNIYIYCALVCFNKTYPDDNEIKNTPPTIGYNSTSTNKYYSAFFETNNPKEIIFNNLLRGQRYKLKCIIESNDGEITKRSKVNTNLETFNDTFIQTSLSHNTFCLEFVFKEEPLDSLKYNLINYCQTLFSSDGFFENGCVICSDTTLNYMNPGLAINQDLTCSTNKISGQFTKLEKMVNNTEQNPQINTTDKNSQVVYKLFTVCPVPLTSCSSDIKDLTKGYDILFRQFANDFSSMESIKDKFGLNISLVLTNTLNDNITPDPTKLSITNIRYDEQGLISWKNTYDGNPLICNWEIIPLNDIKTNSRKLLFDEIIKCVDISWCGTALVNRFGVEVNNYIVKNNMELAKPFDNNSNYSIYYVCFNNVPFPHNPSNVYLVTNFTININLPVETKSNSTSICVNDCSGNHLKMFRGVGLIIFLLIFICILCEND